MAGRGHRIGRGLIALASVALVCAVAASTSVAAVPANVGFNVHLFTDPSPNVTQSLQMEQGAGANVQRVNISWGWIEDRRGVYDSTYLPHLDTIVNNAYALGIRTLITINAVPCWASRDLQSSGSCPHSTYWKYPPTDNQAFGNFVAFLTNRYVTKVPGLIPILTYKYVSELAGIEIWNEPNTPNQATFVTNTPVVDYANMVKAAHAARTNGVPIVAGALWQSGANEDLSFMDQLFAQPGFASSVDIWATHSYGYDDQGVIANVQARRARLGADHSSAPIWVDEFGWPTCTGCNTQQDQARLLVKTFPELAAPALGVTGAISYDFHDDGTDPTQVEQNWGLVTNSYTPKPSYDAVAACLKGGC